MKKIFKWMSVFLLFWGMLSFFGISAAYSADDTIDQAYCATHMGPWPADHPCSTSVSTSAAASAVASATVSAANADIFNILEKKIYNVLEDLRQLIYIIAGFGLVMFSVLAIFNKISYKHLGYIMIGLSLLSLMFPFIEYFSGYTTSELAAQRELTFRSFVDPNVSRTHIQGTSYKEIQHPVDVEGGPSVYAGNSSILEAIGSENLLTAGVTTSSGNGLVGQEMMQAGCTSKASDGTGRGPWSATDMTRKVCTQNSNGTISVTYETCEGKIKNGECKRTLGQNLWNTATNALDFAQNAANVYSHSVGAYVNTVSGISSAGDIINSRGNVLDKINDLSNLTGNTIGAPGSVTHSVQGILGGIVGMGGNVGNTATGWSVNDNNPSGSNTVADVAGGIHDQTRGYQEDVANASTKIDKGAAVGNTIFNIGRAVDNAVGTVDDATDRFKVWGAGR